MIFIQIIFAIYEWEPRQTCDRKFAMRIYCLSLELKITHLLFMEKICNHCNDLSS